MYFNGGLAAYSFLRSMALALATREDANPADAIKEVVESMEEHCGCSAGAFKSELDQVKSMAAHMLLSMGAE